MNKKNIVLLLATTLVPMLQAESHFSKTFLMPQYRKPYDTTHYYFWNKVREELHIKNHKEIEITGFYQESVQDKNIGNYFGASGGNTISIGDTADFVEETFIHNPATNGTMTGQLALAPKRTVAGINLGWNCATEFNYYRWYASLNLPFMSVSHDLRASVLQEKKETIEQTEYGILDFFQGNVALKTANRKQVPLTNAKFGGKQTVTGLASLDALIGCEVVLKDDYALKLYATTSLGTGNKVTGEYLFEPILGAARHSSAGLGCDIILNMFKTKKLNVELITSLESSYHFAATEVRTVGIKDTHGATIPLWEWYSLVGKVGSKGVIPAANILTCPMIIFPGVTLESKMNLICSWNHFDLIAGYCLRAKAAETGWVKAFQDNVYAKAPLDYSCSTAFDPDQDMTATDYNPLITKEHLNLSAALTPAQLTHCFSTGLTWKFAWDDIPVLLKARLKYEVATDNAALEGYDVHLGVGINF